jgi:8-oxo-dGTP diphosphatase
MARAPVMAAGGIVLRHGAPPLFAIVRQRKRNEWVLPKGKLDDGETPLEAAYREVLEETGHAVVVHEFLGTMAYPSGGRAKIVHFWRMEAQGGPVRELMRDVKAVDWVTLDDALARLSRDYERAFLMQTGPVALAAAGRTSAGEGNAPQTLPGGEITKVPLSMDAGATADRGPGLLQLVRNWLRGKP